MEGDVIYLVLLYHSLSYGAAPFDIVQADSLDEAEAYACEGATCIVLPLSMPRPFLVPTPEPPPPVREATSRTLEAPRIPIRPLPAGETTERRNDR